MKRIGLIVAGVLAIFLLLAVFLPSPANRNAPKFVPSKAAPIGNYTAAHYDWGGHRPFINDKVWIFGTRDRTNRFNCLYDLQQRMILGDLHNAGMELVNGDGTKLLVTGVGSPAVTLKERLLKLLERASGGKFKPNVNWTESFWVLNLKDNSAKPIGSVSQYAGTGSSWYTSPGLRYGCMTPTTENSAFVLFDFANDSFTRVPVGGRIRGWWDEQNVFLQAENQDFVLYDVVKAQTKVLFSAEAIRQALEQLAIPTTNVVAFANWNGKEYDFFFTEKDYEFHAKRSFLFKVDRTSPKPALRLVTQSFQFAWGGRFNEKATLYLYQGESGAVGRGGNGAVYLRDLADNSVRTLVPPDNNGQYAIPRFYGGEVIYFRDRLLWRIGLDGSNNVPLFPSGNSHTNPTANR